MIELDEELAEYINHLFQEGDHVFLAGWANSGLRRFFPRCCLHLTTSQLLRRNWQRVHLPARTTPLPWLGARAMAAAFKVRRIDLAIFLRWLRILLVNHGTSFSSLSPCSSFSWSRHGGYCYHQVENLQGTATVFVPARVGAGHSVVLPLDQDFPFKKKFTGSLANFRSSFSALVKSIGLDPLDYLPYCPRRGGATTFISNPLLLPSHVTTLQRHLAATGRVASQR